MKKPPNSALFLLDMGSQAASNLPLTLSLFLPVGLWSDSSEWIS